MVALGNEYSFDELQIIINQANESDEITLEHDYSLAAGGSTLIIKKQLTINGNGHTLDGVGLGRILEVYDFENPNPLILKNIKFINGGVRDTTNHYSNNDGGAISGHGGTHDLILNNCVFENNGASSAGGAIFWEGDLTLIDSQFSYNTVEKGNGGAINHWAGDLIINNTRFENNKVKDGFILADALTDWAWEEVWDALFYFHTDSSARSMPSTGGAIYTPLDVIVENSYFIGNTVGEANQIGTAGGAIHCANVTVRNSTFTSNKAYDEYGGAILAQSSKNSYIYDSTFKDNVANCGGAVATLGGGELNIYNSKFTNNCHEAGTTWTESMSAETILGFIPIVGEVIGMASTVLGVVGINMDFLCVASESKGGAVYSNSFCHIESCNFNNNHITEFGGAVYAHSSAEVIDSTFTTNNVFRGDNIFLQLAAYQGRERDGGAIHCDDNLNIINSSFVRNSAPYEGGAVYVDDECNVYNSIFSYNTAVKQGGAISAQTLGRVFNTTFNSNEVTEEINSDGGAIYIGETCNPTIEKCEFIKNHAKSDGGAIFVDSGDSTLTVSGSRFAENVAVADGGAFYCRGKTNIYSSKFEGNVANGENPLERSYGGAVNSKGNINVENSEFNSNQARRNGAKGGAIYTDSRLAIRNSVFRSNNAEDGGAVYADIINDEIYNSSFIENAATDGDGGAIYINSESWPKFISCTFEDNEAKGDGGAIYTWRGSTQARIADSKFISNYAEEGGAAYVSKITEVTNTEFRDNHATSGSGGALYINNECNPNVHDSTFKDNTATYRGGAVYLDSRNSYLGLNNDVFTSNSAKEGGAVYARQLSEETTYVTFTNNRATSGDGGALYVAFDSLTDYSSTDIFKNCNFDQNTAARKGGAIYYDSVYSWIEKVRNCKFTNNQAKEGGAIFAHQLETIASSEFRGNKATSGDGGAVFIRNDHPTDYNIETDVNNCIFESNSAIGKGGGLCMGSIYDALELYQSEFNYNSAGQGGGVYANELSVGIVRCNFIGNKATAKKGDGGGIYINRKSDFGIISCRFEGNEANNRGGGVYIDSKETNVEISYCTFVHNNAYKKDYNTNSRLYHGAGHSVFNSGYYEYIKLCWFGSNSPNFKGQLVEYHESANDEDHNPSDYLKIDIRVSEANPLMGNPYTVTMYFYGTQGGLQMNPGDTGYSPIYHSDGRFEGGVTFSNLKANLDDITATFVANTSGVRNIHGYLDDQYLFIQVNAREKSNSTVQILSCEDVQYPNALKITYQISPMSDSTYVITDTQGEIVKTGNLTDPNTTYIEGLTPGSYSITISNSPTWDYQAGSDTRTFNITRGDVDEMRVVVYNKNYPEDVECIVYASVDGKYTLTVGNDAYEVTVRNGIGYINIGTLEIGNYEAVVSVAEIDLYVPYSNTTAFAVYSSGTYFAIDLNVTEIDCLQTAVITHTLPEDATGNIRYYLSDGTFLGELPANENFALPLLEGGYYYVIFANYTGDGKYSSDIDSVGVMVNKIDSGFNATIVDGNGNVNYLVTYNQNPIVRNVFSESATGTIRYYLSDGTLIGETPLCNNYSLPKWDPGVYRITANYSGDEYFNPASVNFTIYVNKVSNFRITIDNPNIAYGQEIIIKNILRDTSCGYTSVKYYLLDDTSAHDEFIFLGEVRKPETQFIISGLSVGNHSIFAVAYDYVESTTFPETVSDYEDFTIYAISPEFSLNISSNEIEYGETPTVTPILPYGSGNISYYLSDGTFLGESSVNENFTMPVLDVGSYIIMANYSGDRNYLSATSYITLTVNKAQPAFELGVNEREIIYGISTFATFALPENATGNISYYLGDGTFLGELPINETLALPILNTGSYLIIGHYLGDRNFLDATANTTITINKAETEIFVDTLNTTYKSNEDLLITVKDINGNPVADVVVTVDLNGAKTYTTDENGQINVSTYGLDAKTYDVAITFRGTRNYRNSSNTVTVVINKMPTEIIAGMLNTTYMSKENLLITLKDTNGNPIAGVNVTVDLNGAKTYTTDENGQIRVPTYGLAVKTYDVAITFSGNSNYLESSNATKAIINNYQYLDVFVKDDMNNPFRNAETVIMVNGVTYTSKTDENGYAKVLIKVDEKTNENNGTSDKDNKTDTTSNKDKSSGKTTTTKATPKLTAKKKTFKKAITVKKYTVTLKVNGKALAKKTLYLKIKGKTFKAKTNAKGNAVFKIKKLSKKGKFKATVTFKGDKLYKKVTKKVQIVIK